MDHFLLKRVHLPNTDLILKIKNIKKKESTFGLRSALSFFYMFKSKYFLISDYYIIIFHFLLL